MSASIFSVTFTSSFMKRVFIFWTDSSCSDTAHAGGSISEEAVDLDLVSLVFLLTPAIILIPL